MAKATKLLISPLVGEMPGRAEGGATERHHLSGETMNRGHAGTLSHCSGGRNSRMRPSTEVMARIIGRSRPKSRYAGGTAPPSVLPDISPTWGEIG